MQQPTCANGARHAASLWTPDVLIRSVQIRAPSTFLQWTQIIFFDTTASLVTTLVRGYIMCPYLTLSDFHSVSVSGPSWSFLKVTVSAV